MKGEKTAAIARAGGITLLLAALALHFDAGAWLGRPPRHGAGGRVADPPIVSGSLEGFSEPGLAFQLNQRAVDLAELAEYRSAVEQLEDARHLSPDDEMLRRNLQTVLLNWGTSELMAGHVEEAGRLLRKAASLGERAEVLRVLGILLHKERDYSSAIMVLEDARQLLPRDSNVLLALGDSYLREEKRPQAFDALQQARDSGVSTPGLEALLERLAREIDAEWDFVNLQTPHFQASFADSEEHGSVRIVLDALEDAYTSVGQKLGHFPEGKTPVVLYAQEDFHAATLTPDWAGGAFDGRIKVPLRGLEADDPALMRTLRHEYAHSIIATLAGAGCPVWLNEGLAVWAEEESDGEREEWAWATVARLGAYRFADLDRAFMRLDGRRVESAYAQSYLAVRRIVDRYGYQGLRDFLDALRRSQDAEQALAELFGDSWTGLLHEVEQQARG